MHRYRLCFSKEGELKYISHLELQRTFFRALRRAGIPLVYSGGFNPQPRLVFAAPLAVGIEGRNEYLDIYLQQYRQERELEEIINRELPAGLAVKNVLEVQPGEPSLPSVVQAALYVVSFDAVPEKLEAAVKGLLSSGSVMVDRKGGKMGKEKKRVDIRTYIYDLKLVKEGAESRLYMLLATGSRGGARPDEVLGLLPVKGESRPAVFRREIFVYSAGKLVSPAGKSPVYTSIQESNSSGK